MRGRFVSSERPRACFGRSLVMRKPQRKPDLAVNPDNRQGILVPPWSDKEHNKIRRLGRKAV